MIFQGDKSIKIKRPSIFYRIKTDVGEELKIMLVSETFGNNNYDVIINGVFDFRFTQLKEFVNKARVPELIQQCNAKMDSKYFKVNTCGGADNADCQNMCNYIDKLYGKRNLPSVC